MSCKLLESPQKPLKAVESGQPYQRLACLGQPR